MKEGTSTLASTVVVCICVAILVAFFFFVIWPMIDNNFQSQISCDKATCPHVCNGECLNSGKVDCLYKNQTIKCNFKG